MIETQIVKRKKNSPDIASDAHITVTVCVMLTSSQLHLDFSRWLTHSTTVIILEDVLQTQAHW